MDVFGEARYGASLHGEGSDQSFGGNLGLRVTW
jgi:hypothetical protein